MNQQDADTSEQSRAGILSRLLPARIDNNYEVSKIALWIFGLIVAMRLTSTIAEV